MQQPHTRLCFLLGTLWSHSSCCKWTLALLFLVKGQGKEGKDLLTRQCFFIFWAYGTPKYQKNQLPPQFSCNHSGRTLLIIMTVTAMTLGKSSTSQCAGLSRSKQKISHPAVGAQSIGYISPLGLPLPSTEKVTWVLELGIWFRSQGYTSSID